MRSVLLATSFPPAIGGMETLLYQTSRHLVEPPLVLAPTPAAAADLPVVQVGMPLVQRLAYRPLWMAHPSLHYLARFWLPSRPQHQALATAGDSGRPRVPRAAGAAAGETSAAVRTWCTRTARRYGAMAAAWALLGWTPNCAARRCATPTACCRPATSRARCSTTGTCRPSASCVCRTAHRRDRFWSRRPGRPCCRWVDSSRAKGIDTVIRALSRLDATVEYRVVGQRPGRGAFATPGGGRKASAERVHFLGRLDDAALADEYRRCAAFVQPSRRTDDGQLEGYGLVYFEAAAWGRPVVAGRSGGEVDAVVDGRTGLIVDGQSVDTVADAIRALLADPDRLQTLGAAGRRRVETSHNWANAAAVVDRSLWRLV